MLILIVFDNIILILIGFSVSVVGTIIGAGGGFLIMPILLIFYDFDPKIAIGTTLFFVFFTATSGTISNLRKRKINIKVAIILSSASIPGIILGSTWLNFFNKDFNIIYLKSFIALLMIMIAITLFFKQTDSDLLKKEDLYSNIKKITKKSLTRAWLINFLIGFLAGSFSIGGGLLQIPNLVYILGLSLHSAIITTFFILSLMSFVGMITNLFYNNIDFNIGFFLVIGAVIGAQVGVYLSPKFSVSFLRKGIAIILILMALNILLNSFNII